MQEIDEARNLLQELKSKLEEVNKRIEKKRKQYYDEKQGHQEVLEYTEKDLSRKEGLIKILKNCRVDTCEYKNEFLDIWQRYSIENQEHIRKQDFHFFLCFREDYARGNGKTPIESHQEVIDKNRFCWWGKFFEKRVMGGKFKELEPFGESIKIDERNVVGENIKANIIERINKGKPVYLYSYNPNPPNIKLYVCNVIEFYYRKGEIPYKYDSDEIPPHCAYIPRYYFHKREGNCSSCKEINEAKCELRYKCNFWFKIDKIREIENVEKEFSNLKNSLSNDSINFAIPIIYPLLVFRDNKKFYFEDDVEPITHKSEYLFNVPKKERGHTRTEKVKKLFVDLNKACEQSFVSVESTECIKDFSGSKPKIKHNRGKNDEIWMDLPPTFRRDSLAMRFKILLDKETKPEQKQKVVKMLADYLKRS